MKTPQGPLKTTLMRSLTCHRMPSQIQSSRVLKAPRCALLALMDQGRPRNNSLEIPQCKDLGR